MKHKKDNCTAYHVIIANDCGLGCVNCGACKCGTCKEKPAPVENLHSIECVYHGPTNTRGSRVVLTSHRFKDRVTIPYNYAHNDIVEMAREYLESKGYEIAGMCESKNGYMVLSRTFKSLKA